MYSGKEVFSAYHEPQGILSVPFNVERHGRNSLRFVVRRTWIFSQVFLAVVNAKEAKEDKRQFFASVPETSPQVPGG